MENNLLIYAGCEEEAPTLRGIEINKVYRGLEIGKWVIDPEMLEEMFQSPRIIIDSIPSTWYV